MTYVNVFLLYNGISLFAKLIFEPANLEIFFQNVEREKVFIKYIKYPKLSLLFSCVFSLFYFN